MGIYEKIIFSITSLLFLSKKPKNLIFLLCLTFGFLVAVFFLAEGMSWLLSHFPLEVYSVFTGLIVASLPKLLKFTDKKRSSFLLIGLISIVFFVFLKIIPNFSIQNQISWFVLFMSGFLGFFASILPGLSGSTILLIIGTYHLILKALTEWMGGYLIIFSMGGVLGLICAFYFIHAFLKKRKNLFFCIIIGLIIGSLPKIIPEEQWRSTHISTTIITTISFILIGIILFFFLKKNSSFRKKNRSK